MPRKPKPPRLHLRRARADRGATWVILDRGREVSTGCSEGDLEGAERELARHLAEKYEPPKAGGRLSQIAISDVIATYLKERSPKVKHPKFLIEKTTPLLDWWGDKLLSDVRTANCDAYVKWRTSQIRKKRRGGTVSPQTARADLLILSAAIQHYHEGHGPLDAIPVVSLPPAGRPREDYWLTRKQVAERLWAARRLPKCKHIIRVLLIGVYTGTRPGATRDLRWLPSTSGGWFDLDTETLHRRPQGETESNKKKPKARIHAKLLPWLKRWHRADMIEGVKRRERKGVSRHKVRKPCTHVIHYGGRPIGQLRRSWASVAIKAGHAKKGPGGHWVLPDGPHICRHTAATWSMQSGVDLSEAAGYLGMNPETLWNVYGHHHPDFQQNAARADGKRRQDQRPRNAHETA